MPLSESQIAEVVKLIGDGVDSHRIAEQVGVPLANVAGIRAAQTKLKNQASAEEAEVVDEAVEQKFGLESDMQNALRANVEQLEPGLKVADGGKEQKVASGFIDITAEDKQGVTVVIELKAGTAEHKAIAQLLSYMGDLMSEVKQVRGILVAGGFTDRAISAARAVPNVALKRYSFHFSFAPAK
jgi:RecB family endonuclease NucS